MLNLKQAIEHQAILTFEEGIAWLQSLPLDERISLAEQTATTQATLRKEQALLFYRPVSTEVERFHRSEKQIRLVAGGNRSGKTECNLVDMVIEMTGIVPYSLEGKFPKSRLRPPIRARLIVESLTNTWEPVIKPKLIYSTWNGKGDPGGPQGHYGWIPRHMLIKGKWDESWSEKNRTLTLVNGSTMQTMCLHLNTLILLPNGDWKPLGLIEVDDMVQTRFGPKKVLRTFRYSNAHAYHIKAHYGYELIASIDHRHFLYDGSCKTTRQLVLGDRLLLANLHPKRTENLRPDWQRGYHVITNWNNNLGFAPGQIRFIEPIGEIDVGCLEVEDVHEFIANGVITGNSYDQEVQDFSGSSLHTVRMDEGPPHSIYRENRMRIIDVNGNIAIAMTPPDDESASWDAAWVYDEIYEKGIAGPNKDSNIDAFTFFTEQNTILDRHEIDSLSATLTSRQREVRLFGRFMHLGGRIYTIYTDRPQWWCFVCNDIMLNVDGKCTTCQNKDGVIFQHTINPDREGDWIYRNPIVYLLDPHPRKPHMMLWVTITPSDDWIVIKEMEVDGEPEIVRDKVFDFEKQFDLNIVKRIIDPNMGRSPAHNAGQRKMTVADEFSAVGIRCDDLVSDNFTVGKNRVTAMLRPDPKTREPRLKIFDTCRKTNYQMNRFSFDEWARYSSDQRDAKPLPRQLHDDFPKLLGYLANSNVTYAGLKMGMQVWKREKKRAH